MPVAGAIKLDLIADSQDRATATLRSVQAELKKTEERLQQATGASDKVGASSADLSQKLQALKEGASPVNKVRESFENLRSNAGFVIGSVTALGGAVVGVVSEIVDFVSGADKAAVALKRWEENQKKFNASVDAGWSALDKFSRSPAEAALVDVNTQLFITEGLLKDIRDDEEEWRKKSDEVRGLKVLQAALLSNIAREAEKTADAWGKILRNMKEAETIRLGSVQGPNPFVANSDDADLRLPRNPVTGEVETDEMRAARLKRQKEAADRARARGGGRGGAPRQLAEQRGDFFGQTRQVSDRWSVDPEVAANAKRVVDEIEDASIGADEALRRLFDEGKTEQAKAFGEEVGAVADAIARLGTIGDMVLPGLGSALGNLGSTVGSFASGGIVGGIVGAIGGIADLFSGEDEKRERREREREERARAAEREREERDRRERERDRRRDARQIIIVQSREGIVYGLGADVARVASRTGESLDGTGMSNGRY